ATSLHRAWSNPTSMASPNGSRSKTWIACRNSTSTSRNSTPTTRLSIFSELPPGRMTDGSSPTAAAVFIGLRYIRASPARRAAMPSTSRPSRTRDRDHDRLRIARTAARLMVESGERDLRHACRKAARQLGMDEPSLLPDDSQLQQALQDHL